MSDSDRPAITPKQASPARRLFHSLVALAGWALFVYWWIVVLWRGGGRELRFAGIFVLVCLGVIVAVTGAWVLHNRSISRRKGPRKGLPKVALDYSHDAIGRTVTLEVPPVTLLQAPVVRVTIDGDRKLYQLVRSRPPKDSAA
jgi:hypothetical protein